MLNVLYNASRLQVKVFIDNFSQLLGRLDTRTEVEYSNAVWLMQTNDEGDLDETPSAEASLDQGPSKKHS